MSFKTQDGCLVKELFKKFGFSPKGKPKKVYAKNEHGTRYGSWEYTYDNDPRKVGKPK